MGENKRRRGRPEVGPRIVVLLEPEQLDWLRDYCKRHGVKRSAVVRRLVADAASLDRLLPGGAS
jgi:hypothetical protein